MKYFLGLIIGLLISNSLYSEEITFQAFDSATKQEIKLDSVVVKDLRYNTTTIIYNNVYQELGVNNNSHERLSAQQISSNQVLINSTRSIDAKYRIISLNGELIEKADLRINEGINICSIIPNNITGINFLQIFAGTEITILKISSEIYSQADSYIPVLQKLLLNSSYDVQLFSRGYYPKLFKDTIIGSNFITGMDRIQSVYLYIKGSINTSGIRIKGNYSYNDFSYETGTKSGTDTTSSDFEISQDLIIDGDTTAAGFNYMMCGNYLDCQPKRSTANIVCINSQSPSTIHCTKVIFDTVNNKIRELDFTLFDCSWFIGGGYEQDNSNKTNSITIRNIDYKVDDGRLLIELNSALLLELLSNQNISITSESNLDHAGSGFSTSSHSYLDIIDTISDSAFIRITLSE